MKHTFSLLIKFFSIINIIFFIYDWTVGTNIHWLRAVKLWPNVDRFTARGKTVFVHNSANGLIILLNNAIYPKLPFLKDLL